MGLFNLFKTKRYQHAFKCRKCGHWWLRDTDHVYPTMDCPKCKNYTLAYRRHDREGLFAKR
jgi:phage FluMu protein Com